MISSKITEYDFILEQISENLSITNTMFEKAEQSYLAVGKWLDEGLSDYNVTILPQGSFNLGTVIKPINDADDYDIDLVCLVNNKKLITTPKHLKHLIGNRLKEHKTYNEKLEDEGKRCWTLVYDEFHMDILPSVPKKLPFNQLLNSDIILTHTDDKQNYHYKESNPFEYRDWFIKQTKKTISGQKQFCRSSEAIEQVPKYHKTSVLQECIKLLKRHRDYMFQNSDDAPISMIITTLAASAYDGNQSITFALEKILDHMTDFIIFENNEYKIINPVNEKENFADKWNSEINKVTNFYTWLDQAKKDLIEIPLKTQGYDELCTSLESVLGKSLVQRSLNNCADLRKKLRESNKLYIKKDLKSEFSLDKRSDTLLVKEHTFFGK